MSSSPLLPSPSSSIMSFMKEPKTIAITSFLALVIASRSHYSRYLKKLTMPAILTLLAYHYSSAKRGSSELGILMFQETKDLIYELPDSVLSSIINVLFMNNTRSKAFNRVLADIFGIAVVGGAIKGMNDALSLNPYALVKLIKDTGYDLVKSLPAVQAKIGEERDKLQKSLRHDLKYRVTKMGSINQSLPDKGMDSKGVLTLMERESSKENGEWGKGKISGSVYHGMTSHQQLLNQVISYLSLLNSSGSESGPLTIYISIY